MSCLENESEIDMKKNLTHEVYCHFRLERCPYRDVFICHKNKEYVYLRGVKQDAKRHEALTLMRIANIQENRYRERNCFWVLFALYVISDPYGTVAW